ncbi:MAG: arsenosugar biosynthesis radical SAM protein ArsS [Magnetococcales bacterium]|nr:arsenosugar biosynthesis radical SAM protein ArsS [Magnetococcales bacterium]MBF0151147.1 arsenosugar biosynthesis radical SAM protein ArsS [Magnetococcales bacterium]MBF0172539.1 arsenosugar biosynthesis radical SAM protein ArsS [Magnetococcales bacterium]MBF0347065.1 arsenosugar biosynthesis radical SAM protein ArsS [Magnetococcales bacterium]MBF0629992.1 arsenosugar biosynthesis radical SAM protein ArsS [Magnetococcales bacterium]
MNIKSSDTFRKNIRHYTGQPELHSGPLEVIQVNVGLQCNLECHHCHVAASPRRKERMEWPVMAEVISLAERSGCTFVDITGGAPELNPHLPRLIDALVLRGINVQVRTNLSVHLEPGMERMASFFRDRKVTLVGSMPCYLESNVDKQRGEGTFKQAIAAMRRLNDLGFGRDPERVLNLVYNPLGARLPPDPCQLEQDYRRELMNQHGIVFSRLLTITNMPIGRFRTDLARQGNEESYWKLLLESFNPATLDGLMCRNQISVAWDGTLFDCDFNLALKKPARLPVAPHIQGLDPTLLNQRAIVIDDHCFACTAGRGSSCAGALVA